MTEAYDGRQVVGMDLHRRRSVLVRMTEDGRKLETARITNTPAALRAVIARAGQRPRVVVEATYGWYWAADVPEAWIAPPPVRELREITRYRILCRHRHRCRYAEARIMPGSRPVCGWRVVPGRETSA